MMQRVFILAALLAGLAGAAGAGGLAVQPPVIELHGREATQRLAVLTTNERGEVTGSGAREDLVFVSSDPAVAVVRDGAVRPVGNGTATITVMIPGERDATAEVRVTGYESDHAWSFRNHVLPVLSRAGCNMGACHGALAGKGGFRLSLRGYDPERDYHTITREARGRRIEPSDPGRSLLLTKGTTALKHTGGKRITPRSRDYRIIAEWITAGAPAPGDDDARLERLEIFPELSTLQPGDSLPLVVRARYTGGREEDVTRWARFSSSNEAVATVADDGTVTVVGHGEGAVTAWFSAQIVIARVSAPYPNELPEEVFAGAPRRNLVDDLVLSQLRRLNLAPSPRSDDATFLRRVHLDVTGALPSPEQTRAFLADRSPEKRDRVIEELLASDAYVDYWSYRWSDVFLVNGRRLRPEAVKAYYGFIRGNVAANTPWDEFARRIVTAKGSSVEEGATNFYAVHQDPETMAENVSQAFLSLSLNCAKCHDHPLEKWTNDQYYAFANLFSRVRAKGWGGDARSGDGVRTVWVEPRGDLIQPRTGKPQPPAPLDAEPLDGSDPADRREALARWLTSPDNEFFSRSIANRVWANFFGIGLVEPVDDLRASNPASNEPLLAALAEHLAGNGFDLKELMRLILRSETYQRSSEVLASNRDEDRFFSRAYPRRLMSEVLHDAVADVTGVPSVFGAVELTDGSTQATKFYPAGTRALQLYDSAVQNYFLDAFGRNEREISCECERSNQPSLVQVLHISNGQTMNDKLAEFGSVADRLLGMAQGRDDGDRAIVAEAYLLCLSRLPAADERERFRTMLAEAPISAKREVVEDLLWALMSSREFLFQH